MLYIIININVIRMIQFYQKNFYNHNVFLQATSN